MSSRRTPLTRTVTRRRALQAGAAGVAAAGLSTLLPGAASAAGMRAPGSLPNPALPAGTVDASLPFDHIVIVMMENHSFDNYLGMLPLRGQPLADGFSFDAAGKPTNSNPVTGGRQVAFHLESTCQPGGVTQSWDSSHRQINGGAMDGFATTAPTAMGYWDDTDLPFYYSLANTFTLANRWFCSVPAQTYPNRRFLYAGTATGDISTSSASITSMVPANGTMMDLLTKYGVSWKNYFTDLPATAIISRNVENHPSNYSPIAEFFSDCAAGLLPSVSYVDPEFGLADEVGGELRSGLGNLPFPLPASITSALQDTQSQGGDEENPRDVRLGEAFVAQVVNAVMSGPLWARTLLIWTYDEHGGYYDHVAPPAALKPDSVAPDLDATNVPGAYDLLGPRVPAVVVSPYSKPHAVTNVVHDHTSLIATIAAKYNLPALTYRDANASTVFDFVDFAAKPAFLTPPTLAAASAPTLGLMGCDTTAPAVVVEPDSPASAGSAGSVPATASGATTGATTGAITGGRATAATAGRRTTAAHRPTVATHRTVVAQPTRTLAFTGAPTGLDVAAGVAIAAAAATAIARRRPSED